MALKKETEKEKRLRTEFVSRLIALFTASFGLIAALAWNQVAQEIANNYIKPVFGQDSGLITMVIYAVIVTVIAVIVAYYLSRVVKED